MGIPSPLSCRHGHHWPAELYQQGETTIIPEAVSRCPKCGARAVMTHRDKISAEKHYQPPLSRSRAMRLEDMVSWTLAIAGGIAGGIIIYLALGALGE